MDIFTSIDDLDLSDRPGPRVMTAGVFDGVHRGHQRLLARAREAAGDGCGVVFSFPNHPLSVLAPAYQPRMLLSEERKRTILDRLGVDVLISPHFTPELANLEPGEFIERVIVKACRVERVIVGFDFRFGRGGGGDAAFLKSAGERHGFEVEVLPPVYHREWPISSTRIRELIEEGRAHTAMEMLGRPHELEGPVIHGFGRGTALGFPTANLVFDARFAMPGSGVYAVLATVDGGNRAYRAMMNIGVSPTFAGTEYRPEVFLLDYEGDSLYERRMRVYFIERIREERKFPDAEALIERIRTDERIARAVLEGADGLSLFL
jgi:riboflavin kinase/FMN adenylyltransferase